MSAANELRDYATAIDGGYAGELNSADAHRIRLIASHLEAAYAAMEGARTALLNGTRTNAPMKALTSAIIGLHETGR